MKIAIITGAGVSSRFNEGVPEAERRLKVIYYEKNKEDTLLFHLLSRCARADRILLVGGYRYASLEEYLGGLKAEVREKTELVRNDRYEDLGSGYSLYLGLKKAFEYGPEEILFAEGDLDADAASFRKVFDTEGTVLTWNSEPIYAKKAVALYRDGEGRYRYAFNSSHGLLKIGEPFSCILNSGQIWKFGEPEILRQANDDFFAEEKDGTNLRIIQRYLDACKGPVTLVGIERWTNCNTREDYRKILSYWENER